MTTSSKPKNKAPGCPASADTFTALWAGELTDAEAAAMEEHLFLCDSCSDYSEGVGAVIEALREKLPFVISHAHRERLIASGQRVAVTEIEPTLDPAVRKSARFTPDVDLLIFALRGDVSNADRVDVRIAAGDKAHLLEDVPFDRDSGEVLICCQRHFEGMFESDPIFTVQSVKAGQRQPVGEYIVTHVWR
jgi:hypothetical protein